MFVNVKYNRSLVLCKNMFIVFKSLKILQLRLKRKKLMTTFDKILKYVFTIQSEKLSAFLQQ